MKYQSIIHKKNESPGKESGRDRLKHLYDRYKTNTRLPLKKFYPRKIIEDGKCPLCYVYFDLHRAPNFPKTYRSLQAA